MKILKIDKQLNDAQIDEIVTKLKAGGLIVYPTETAYGVGALASFRTGVDKLMRYKGDRAGKAVSVAVTTRNMAGKYVVLNDLAKEIYERYLPGPITVISRLGQGAAVVDELVPNRTLGIRLPDHIIPKQIIDKLGEGITSTSANESGGKTPYKVADVLDNISDEQKGLIDIVIDFGELPMRATSTIVNTVSEPAWILRGEGRGLKFKSERENLSLKKENELESLAQRIIKKYAGSNKNLILLLIGDLGSGKTRFVQAFAGELGINENVISPSFVLERQYNIPNSGRLFHYDFWRLEQKEIIGKEKNQILEALGIYTALKTDKKNVIAIEWPDRVGELAPFFKLIGCDVVKVNFEVGNEKEERAVKVEFFD